MDWDYTTFSKRLAGAEDRGDREEVSALVDELIGHLAAAAEVYPEEEAARILGILRRKRSFAEITRAADAFMAAGQKAPVIRRQYGQALIEESEFAQAIDLLEGVVAETEPGSTENREARGLIGRAYKQRYVDAESAGHSGSAEDIANSINAYWMVYGEDPDDPIRFWHGINAVAVIERARADGVAIPHESPNPEEVAESIRGAIELMRLERSASMWDLATAIEACVALGRPDEALDWALTYTQHPNADAFEFASTLRQLQQVWRLTPEEDPGKRLLPVIQAALLQQEDGILEVTSNTDLDSLADLTGDGNFEAVLGEEMFKNVRWLENALGLGESVARVRDNNDSPKGTAFVVRHGDLDDGAGDPEELLLLTNAHVISELEDDEPALVPAEARISFERDSSGVVYEVDDVVWGSPKHELDATLIRTMPPIAGHEPVELAARLPRLNDRVYIIGHPGDKPLSYSIYDNRLLNVATPHLHYRTPTEGGSSGSPVFNRQWQLIGLHHKGNLRVPVPDDDDLQPANEGITIDAITEAVPGDAELR